MADYSELKRLQEKINKQDENTPEARELRQLRQQERVYGYGRQIKELRNRQEERLTPVRTRVKRVGRRGFGEIQESYKQTNKTLIHRGPGVIRQIASGFKSVRGSVQGSEHTGLSSIVNEITRNYVPSFERSYFKEPNEADRDFFGNQNQPEEKDFFGHGNETNIDMTNLTSSNQNKKNNGGETQYV